MGSSIGVFFVSLRTERANMVRWCVYKRWMGECPRGKLQEGKKDYVIDAKKLHLVSWYFTCSNSFIRVKSGTNRKY